MRAKIKKELLEKIKHLFSEAKKLDDDNLSRKYIALARQIAKRNNIKLPQDLRKKFCHKCNVYFTAKNKKTRIKNKKISIKCLNCNSYVRYKIS